MITNNGVEIISKYLVGQASSYASYIAVGTGGRPASNSQAISVIPPSTTITIAIVSAVAPYEATLTITGTGSNDYWSYLEVGDTLVGSQINNSPSYTLSGGTVTVKSINSPKQISVYSTSVMVAGTSVPCSISAKSSLASLSLAGKESLDFEVARFPISSRSYITEKQTVSPSSLYITSPSDIVVNIAVGHPFGIGDEVNISEVRFPNSISDPSEVFEVNVNGVYIITSISDSSFTAKVFPGSVTGWSPDMYSYAFVGRTDNGGIFNATVFTKQVSFSAEMTDALRYDISELGIYSLGSNQFSDSGSSRMLLSFTQAEPWEYYDQSTELSTTIALGNGDGENDPVEKTVLPLVAPLFSSTTDSFWGSTYRTLRQEKPRILDSALVLPGNLSDRTGFLIFTSTSDYITLSNPGVNLSRSSGSDEIRLAYSIINAVGTTTELPTAVYIMFEFVSSNGIDTAKIYFSESNPGLTIIYPNRYGVLTSKVSEISVTEGFNWSNVTSVKVYSAIEVGGAAPVSHYAVVLDGLRFENTNTENPLYALTAYTLVNNAQADTIKKIANSNDLINFRIDLAVGK